MDRHALPSLKNWLGNGRPKADNHQDLGAIEHQKSHHERTSTRDSLITQWLCGNIHPSEASIVYVIVDPLVRDSVMLH